MKKKKVTFTLPLRFVNRLDIFRLNKLIHRSIKYFKKFEERDFEYINELADDIVEEREHTILISVNTTLQQEDIDYLRFIAKKYTLTFSEAVELVLKFSTKPLLYNIYERL